MSFRLAKKGKSSALLSVSPAIAKHQRRKTCRSDWQRAASLSPPVIRRYPLGGGTKRTPFPSDWQRRERRSSASNPSHLPFVATCPRPCASDWQRSARARPCDPSLPLIAKHAHVLALQTGKEGRGRAPCYPSHLPIAKHLRASIVLQTGTEGRCSRPVIRLFYS